MCCCVRSLPIVALLGLIGVVGYQSSTGQEPVRATAKIPEEKAAADGKNDLTMFGGTNSRNMVNLVDKNIPSVFPKDAEDPKKFILGDLVKWKATLGSRAYGGPIIANGKVYVGTNNENPRNKRDVTKNNQPIDRGILMCFNEADGEFIWQAVHDKLPSGQVNDWPREGICSTPIVLGDRIYYVTNRCTVVCADVNGFANGNDGIKTEKYTDKTDADIIWEYDMMKEDGVFPHNMSACSPLIVGDLIFITTANGVDENHNNIPAPKAPSFMALNIKTGKLIWKDSSPGKDIMHGQWSNMTYGVVKGIPQVIFTGGDGWLYSFEPDTGKLIWKFDASPKDSKYDLGGKGTKSDFIGTPVIYNDLVYIGTGQDPEHYEGIGHFWCIDPTKKGDVSPELVTDDKKDPPETKSNPNSAVVWHYGGQEKRQYAKRDYVFGRTMSTAAIVDDVIYIAELAGYLHVLDAKTGKKYYQYDLKSSVWGSPYYVDGKVYIGNEDGDLFVFKHEKKPAELDEVELASKEADEKAAAKKLKDVKAEVAKKYLLAKVSTEVPIRSTPVVANGILYIMTETTLFAVKGK